MKPTAERMADLACDEEHLKGLVALWAENTLIHQLAARLLAVMEAQPVAWASVASIERGDVREVWPNGEHNKAGNLSIAPLFSALPAPSVPDDWIEHDGNGYPSLVKRDAMLFLKTRKQEIKFPYPAGLVKGWCHIGRDTDILAYKLATPTPTNKQG